MEDMREEMHEFGPPEHLGELRDARSQSAAARKVDRLRRPEGPPAGEPRSRNALKRQIDASTHSSGCRLLIRSDAVHESLQRYARTPCT